jgi:hypothetical protein
VTIFTEEILRTYERPERDNGDLLRWVWRKKVTRKIDFALRYNSAAREFTGRDYRAAWRHLLPHEIAKLKRLLPPEAIAECTRSSLVG